MIGEFIMSDGNPCRCEILEHKSRHVVKVRAMKFKPFFEYGYFNETSATNIGYVRKGELTGLESDHIKQVMGGGLSSQVVFHDPNIAHSQEEWVNGQEKAIKRRANVS